MFIGYNLYSGNVADTFLGSFSGTFEITDVDCCNNTATVTFKIHNKTGWRSATKYFFGTSFRRDESGVVYEQYISWSETLTF